MRTIGILLLLTACQTAPPRDDLDQILSAAAELAQPAVVDIWGKAKIHYPPSLAEIPGGLPMVVPPQRPIVGVPWACGFTTRPTAPFVSDGAALLMTFAPPPSPQIIPNGAGGMLMVPITTLVRPRPGTALTMDDGTLELRYTFPASLAGLRVWMQMIVKDPRSGVTVSPMLEILVGTK
jgi:hypothetical protein